GLPTGSGSVCILLSGQGLGLNDKSFQGGAGFHQRGAKSMPAAAGGNRLREPCHEPIDFGSVANKRRQLRPFLLDWRKLLQAVVAFDGFNAQAERFAAGEG